MRVSVCVRVHCVCDDSWKALLPCNDVPNLSVYGISWTSYCELLLITMPGKLSGCYMETKAPLCEAFLNLRMLETKNEEESVL